MTTAQPKTKLNRFEETNLLQALHDNSRRTTSILYKHNPCFLQCWYPNFDLGIPSMKGPVCQFVYNGGKRSPFMDMEDATKLLEVVKYVHAHGWKMFPGYEETAELKSGRVKVSWNKLWFVDARCPRFQTGQTSVTDEFIVNLMGSLIMFTMGGQGADEYPTSAVSCVGFTGIQDELFAVTDFGQNAVNSKPSWLRYTHNTTTKAGSLTLNYGDAQFHVQDKSIRGVDWEFFINQISWAVLQVVKGTRQHVEVFKDHPNLSKYNTYVRKFDEGNRTYLIINTDIHAYNNKVMFQLTETNAGHLKQFFMTIENYHK